MRIGRREFVAASAASLALLSSRGAAKPLQHLWRFDNLKSIGGHPVRVEGAPSLMTSHVGPALHFDGNQDALFIPNHPLAGARTFTWEAIFRADGGAFEQRWFHLESGESPAVEAGKGNTRMLFEIRVVGDSWYLDAFVKGLGYNHTLAFPDKLHPVGRWYHVAQNFDGRMYRSFVNGELQGEAEVAFTPQGPGHASVGVRLNKVNYFAGSVALARFTHAALQPAEFLSLPSHGERG
jgi:hypothetical protein